MSNAQETRLIVSPTTQRANLNPGETFSGELHITNPSHTDPLRFKISVSPYSVSGEEYSADLATVSEYTKVTDWVAIDHPEGTLDPDSDIFVHYSISVPEDAKSGGQYCALSVQSLPATDSSASQTGNASVQNIIEISSLIYSQIGNPVFDGEILENKIPGFTLNDSIKTVASVKNTGGTHQNMRVSIKAFSALTGSQIPLGTNLKPEDLTDEEIAAKGTDYYSEVILPDTTRSSLHEVKNLPLVDILKVTQEISFNGEVNTAEQTVFVCPLWLIALALAVLIFAVATIFKLIFSRKKSPKKS